VKMDPDRMAQALGNLLSNAIRYTPPGGKVVLSALAVEKDVLIQVNDSGPGIATEEQSQIFTPFYRGKAARRFSDGMGLGLTISKDLIEAHGGELKVESRPGQGSLFIICLPAVLS
jgi:two-component system, OmpR family, sensor histidine kinase BaeS